MPEEFQKIELDIITKWLNYFQKNILVEKYKQELLTDIILYLC